MAQEPEKLGKKKKDETLSHIAPPTSTSQPVLQMESFDVEEDPAEDVARIAETLFINSFAGIADTHPLPYLSLSSNSDQSRFPLSNNTDHVLRKGVVVSDPLDHAAKREAAAKAQKNSSTMFRPAPAQPLTVAEQLADTAIEVAAKNAALAVISALLLAFANVIKEAVQALCEHAKTSNALFTESAQVFASIGCVMGR